MADRKALNNISNHPTLANGGESTKEKETENTSLVEKENDDVSSIYSYVECEDVLVPLPEKIVVDNPQTENQTLTPQKWLKKPAPLKKPPQNGLWNVNESKYTHFNLGDGTRHKVYPLKGDGDNGVNVVQFYFANEAKYLVHANYLDKTRVSRRERFIMINRMVEVHCNFFQGKQDESLAITVNLIDRFMKKSEYACRENLHAIGLSSLSLACKLETRVTLDNIREQMVELSAGEVSIHDMNAFEDEITRVLNFDLFNIHAFLFLQRIQRGLQLMPNVYICAKYLIVLSFHDPCFCNVLPSIVAAAAVLLAQRLLTPTKCYKMPLIFEISSGYKLEEVVTESEMLMNLLRVAKEGIHIASYTRFKGKGGISDVPELRPKALQNICIHREINEGTYWHNGKLHSSR